MLSKTQNRKVVLFYTHTHTHTYIHTYRQTPNICTLPCREKQATTVFCVVTMVILSHILLHFPEWLQWQAVGMKVRWWLWRENTEDGREEECTRHTHTHTHTDLPSPQQWQGNRSIHCWLMTNASLRCANLVINHCWLFIYDLLIKSKHEWKDWHTNHVIYSIMLQML